MKLYKSCIFLFGTLLFAGCVQGNDQRQDQKNPETQDKIIRIVNVKLDGDIVSTNQTISSLESSAELEIEFKEAYQDLKVMVENKKADVTGKLAKFTLQDIPEIQKTFSINITAKDKDEKLLPLTIKKKQPEAMEIEQILLGSLTCHENATTIVKTDEALLLVKWGQAYPGLKVKVDWKGQKIDAQVQEEKASIKLTGISNTKEKIEIIATAKGRITKRVPFFVQKEGEGVREIVISSVTIDDDPCVKGQIVESKTQTPALKVTFAKAYSDLAVKVNDIDITLENAVATYQFSNIDENKIEVNIVATAKDKDETKFNFFLKKEGLKEMTISKVLLDTVECKENKEVLIKDDSATLTVSMQDAYPNLAVFVAMGNKAEQALQVSGKNATFLLAGFNESAVTINIRATATGYINKTYSFTAKKEKETIASDNAFLKSLVLYSDKHVFDMDTEFKKDKEDYEAYVAEKYTQFDLKAQTEDENASVGEVKKELQAGILIYSVEVTASDKRTKKTYKVTIKKIPALKAEKQEVVTVPVPVSGIEFPHEVNDEGSSRVEKAFSIGKWMVTYQLWCEVYNWAAQAGYKFKNGGVAGRGGDEATGNYPNGSPKPAPVPEEKKFFPVTNISWYDAIVWLNAYSICQGYNALYVYQDTDGNTEIIRDATAKIEGSNILKCEKAVARDMEGFRLPKELEWRCAARWQGVQDKGNSKGVKQKDGSTYFFTKGDSASGATSNSKEDATKVAWFSDDGNYETHAVGLKQANNLGVFDMSGLMEEWLFEGDGAKKRYLLGGNVDKEDVSDIAVGSPLDMDVDAGAADDFVCIRVIKNEK